VRFQVLTATSLKTAALWNIVQCSLVEVDLIMEAARTSETSVYFETTRHCIPEGCIFKMEMDWTHAKETAQ
jgi:hypothetical protein